ncbi:phosphoserine phosphatase SerB [Martelella soudanensis]|uniref:phosphoserine phosphatase SerB n=1 Tax=unclassified Martelella TaxID=2629616 RepID=UPI0015DE5C76|nr:MULTISPECIES: phosphoserine phosphatase SerB [unclassified Martelella]
MALVATLVANPSNPVVTGDLVSRLSSAVNAGKTEWLATGVAADLMLAENTDGPAAETTLRSAIGALPVDVVIQKASTRRKKALLADMDSTMIGQECIDELAAEVGLKDKVAAITARAMNGEIEFEPAVRERVALLKGLSIDIVDEIIEKRITLTSGGKELIATMKANGGYAALVSGGFTVFTSRIAAMLGFDENRANILLEDKGRLTGHVADPILGREAKVEALRDVAARRGISEADIMAVGDGANDLGMIRLAGSGVALHAKPKVAAEASIRIDHGDLTALLYIQGYRLEEFAR